MLQTACKPIHTQHPAISQLATTIKTIWGKQLRLFPYKAPDDLGYIEGVLEGERLVIQNLCYQTLQFRKLHLEIAKVGESLDILHCVMFPYPCFDLPIFGVDIVAVKNNITAAIVDLSPVSAPVSAPGSLPERYQQAIEQLGTPQFATPRALPEWGDIFSNHCLFVRPETAEESDRFLNRAAQFLSLHCQIACEASKIDSKTARAAILAGQNHYCSQQRKNDKTRRILERAFGKQWAHRYLETMLFDCASDDSNEFNIKQI